MADATQLSHTPTEGDAAPAFTLPTADGGTLSLADLAGARAVLFFFPRADTPACTTEAQDFTAALPAFDAAGTRVIGISKDPAKKLARFAQKQGLGVTLLSDDGQDVCERFGVWKEKQMYGKTYMGIERSTFLIGPDGRILRAWRGISVPGHAAEVQAALA